MDSVLQEPVQSPQNIKKSFKLPKKMFLISVVVIIFLGLIAGIYVMGKKGNRKIQGIWMKVPFQKPTPSNTPFLSIAPSIDPTLYWKIYSNKSFNIKYPSRFSVTEKEIPYTTLYPKIYSSTEFSDGIDTITITVAKNNTNFTLNTISGSGPFIRYAEDLVSEESKTIVKIDNTDSLVTTRIPTGTKGLAKELLLLSNNKIYQLTLSPIDNDTTTFDTMINTFHIVNQEPSDITENWFVYTNSYYGYTFKYPTNYGIDHEKNATISALTIVYNPGNTSSDAPKFKIEAQDIKNISLSNITSRSFLGLPLDQYVTKKWEYNIASNSAIPDKKTSAIKETNVAGKVAYQFSVTDEYRDDRVTEKLSEEYLFYFTESGGYKYKIWFPKSDITYNEVLKTLMFIK